MTKFPDEWAFQGVRAPSRLEIDVEDLEVEGEIPPGIDGAFYRSSADHQFPPRHARDTPFNADGMIHRYRFQDGKVSLKTRYARTDKFLTERAAGAALFGKYRNRHLDDPSVDQNLSRALANTNVLIHGGILLGLWEGANAFAMDPLTMESIGNWDFHGTVNCPTVSAHSKIDPVTGNLVCFGFAAKGEFTTDTVYFEVSPDGKVIHETSFNVPYFAELHDSVLTADYLCIPIVPVLGCGDEELKNGTTYYGWDTEKEIYLAVIPRFGTAEGIRFFTAPNQFTSHTMNGWNEGTKVFFDTAVSPSSCFPWWPKWGEPFDPSGFKTQLTRWTVDMASDSNEFESVEILSEFNGEFCKVDDRYLGRKYRHGWQLLFTDARDALAHIDVETRNTTIWKEPKGMAVGEPCFIPRSADAPEGDGWILSGMTDPVTTLTELHLFEALALDKGPIAKIKVPAHLKPAYHGNWFNGDQITPSGWPTLR